jgi:hypothetical protein
MGIPPRCWEQSASRARRSLDHRSALQYRGPLKHQIGGNMSCSRIMSLLLAGRCCLSQVVAQQYIVSSYAGGGAFVQP